MTDHICPPDHRHGANTTCYRTHRCRCVPCRQSNAELARFYRSGEYLDPDPYAVDQVVDGVPVFLTIRQREEAVRVLWGRRWSDPVIAERLGITDRSVVRIRKRLGLAGWKKSELARMRFAA